MKGKLLKKDNKWVIIVEGAPTYFEVDLHPDDFENIQNFNDSVWDLNGKEVFFEIVTKYIEPDDSIHCNRGVDKEFAKLIDEGRRKEALSEIIKQAQELGIYEDGFYTKISQVEQLALEEFKKVSDEGLFPNHTDKDIWISGFKSGVEFNNWDDNKVIDFVNWFLKLHKLPFNYTLENREILESFKRGDDFSLWHTKEE